nr:transposase [Thermosipho japonicus]
MALFVNGYSRSMVRATLQTLNLPYQEEAIEDLTDLIYDHLDAYRTSPLPEELFAVFIDAYHGKLRDENGKVVDVSIFVALGIDMEGYKQGKESKEFWIEVFQDMLTRGMSKVAIFVTDDFRGITSVVKKLFPNSEHQLCWVHMKRNLKRGFGGKGYSQMRRILDKVR